MIRIARFGGRFMDMRTCRLDVGNGDLAFDAFIIRNRDGAASGCRSLEPEALPGHHSG